MKQDIPQNPGIYVFRNNLGKVIYVGKAKNLRRRVSSYLQPSRLKTADPKLRSLIKSISEYETFVVASESESLLLESQLIKKYAPRYNIDLRDDKRFYLFKVDVNAPFPKLYLARLKKNDGALYFGPFPNAGAVKQTQQFLINHFRLRTCHCTIPTLKDYQHCLDDVIRNCSAPCVMEEEAEAEYRMRIEQLLLALNGKTKIIIEELEVELQAHIKALHFEKAALVRDTIFNLKSLFSGSTRSFVHAKISTDSGLKSVKELQKLLHLPIYPRRIECFDNSNLFGNQAVASMVCFIDGKPSSKNYRRYKIKTVQGIDDFASMNEIVGRRYRRVMEENLERPDLILIDGGRGQLSAAMNILNELGLRPVEFNPSTPVQSIEKDEVIVMGLAKREEELFLPGMGALSVKLPKHSLALRMLRYIRDEAHRFAITFHREYRNKAISNSILDDIPKIGIKRKKALLTHFGSVTRLRKASLEQLLQVDGVGPIFAKQLFDYFDTNNKKDGK
ncbi:MAG: excinuclease ABC subunit UvrC [Lentisphaeria bacterium]|nr:excinuclease ABC subunit UvrC [Lentisphaeria bacterium]